jgi:hypothetical protein
MTKPIIIEKVTAIRKPDPDRSILPAMCLNISPLAVILPKLPITSLKGGSKKGSTNPSLGSASHIRRNITIAINFSKALESNFLLAPPIVLGSSIIFFRERTGTVKSSILFVEIKITPLC